MLARQNYVQNHGFTLVELLAIIVILATLAAILCPVLVKVHDKATQSTCLQNQRRLIALLAYAEDHDATLPLPSDWVNATGLSGEPAVWACPSAEVKGTPASPRHWLQRAPV